MTSPFRTKKRIRTMIYGGIVILFLSSALGLFLSPLLFAPFIGGVLVVLAIFLIVVMCLSEKWSNHQ